MTIPSGAATDRLPGGRGVPQATGRLSLEDAVARRAAANSMRAWTPPAYGKPVRNEHQAEEVEVARTSEAMPLIGRGDVCPYLLKAEGGDCYLTGAREQHPLRQLRGVVRHIEHHVVAAPVRRALDGSVLHVVKGPVVPPLPPSTRTHSRAQSSTFRLRRTPANCTRRPMKSSGAVALFHAARREASVRLIGQISEGELGERGASRRLAGTSPPARSGPDVGSGRRRGQGPGRGRRRTSCLARRAARR